MRFATGLAVAGLMALGMAGSAFADGHVMTPMSMFQCNTACSQSWSQCVAGGTDMMLASSPEAGMSKMQMNAQNATACAQQAQACYSSCM